MSYNKDRNKNDQLMVEIQFLTNYIHKRNMNEQVVSEGASFSDIDQGISIIERASFNEKARHLLILFLKSLHTLQQDQRILNLIDAAKNDPSNFMSKAHELLKSLEKLQKNPETQDLINAATNLSHELMMIRPVVPDPAYSKIYEKYKSLMKDFDKNISSKEKIQSTLKDLKEMNAQLILLKSAIVKYSIEINESQFSPRINEKDNYLLQVEQALTKVESKLQSLKKYDQARTLTDRAKDNQSVVAKGITDHEEHRKTR